jgi:predicted ArsR family transcriptional regulator
VSDTRRIRLHLRRRLVLAIALEPYSTARDLSDTVGVEIESVCKTLRSLVEEGAVAYTVSEVRRKKADGREMRRERVYTLADACALESYGLHTDYREALSA